MNVRCRPLLLSLLAVVLVVPPVTPCTAFLVAGNDQVLLGNNEDFWDPRTEVWFEPGKDGRYGAVYLGYVGHVVQGGMNTEGLAFDGFATPAMVPTEQGGKPVFEGELLNEALETCATVEEVAELFYAHDLTWLTSAQLLFADRLGNSVIIEGDEFLFNEHPFQVATNFYQSQHDDHLQQCDRFAAATVILDGAEQVSVDLCRRALAATAQEIGAPTLYSNVFDLKAGRMHLYNFHNFEDVRVFDLEEELKKGARTLDLPTLFGPNHAYAHYLEMRQDEIGQAVAARRGPPLAHEVLDGYAGRWIVDNPAGEPIRVDIRRAGPNLVVDIEGRDGPITLIPQSSTVFFEVNLRGEQELVFQGDPTSGYDTFTGLWLPGPGRRN